jgi:hypothetical protein
VVAPGDQDKGRIDDPDTILLEELGHGAVVADKLLHQVADRRKRADRAPEPTQEHENNRDERPPQHPGQRGTEVVVCGARAEHQLVDNQREDNQRRPLEDSWIGATTEEAPEQGDLQEINALLCCRPRCGSGVDELNALHERRLLDLQWVSDMDTGLLSWKRPPSGSGGE